MSEYFSQEMEARRAILARWVEQRERLEKIASLIMQGVLSEYGANASDKTVLEVAEGAVRFARALVVVLDRDAP